MIWLKLNFLMTNFCHIKRSNSATGIFLCNEFHPPSAGIFLSGERDYAGKTPAILRTAIMDRKSRWISSSSLLSASGTKTRYAHSRIDAPESSWTANRHPFTITNCCCHIVSMHSECHIDFPRAPPVLQQLKVIQQAACSALSQHTISAAAFSLIKRPVCPHLKPFSLTVLAIRNNSAATGADGNNAFRQL